MEDQFREIELSDSYESPLNTRKHFDETALAELTESVRAKDILVPLLVRKNPWKGKTFEVLAGARRRRAAERAEKKVLPVRVIEATDAEALEIIVLENLQREDVHPLEEAEGYRALLERSGYDVSAIAAKVGKSESYIYQRLKLLDLIPAAQKAFLTGEITAGHAVLIARLGTSDQVVALKECFQEVYPGEDVADRSLAVENVQPVKALVGVRALQAFIAGAIMRDLAKVPFDVADADLVKSAGPCTTCPKRSGYAPMLFADVSAKNDTCTDRSCFQGKIDAFIKRQKAEVTAESGTAAVELSEAHQSQKKGVLALHQYKPAGKKSCASTTKGVMTDGKDLGKVFTVCTDKNCKTHGRSSHHIERHQPTPAEKARRAEQLSKERIEAEVRRRFVATVTVRSLSNLSTVDHLRIFALAYLREVWNDTVKALCERRGWERKKVKRAYGDNHESWSDTARSRFREMKTGAELIAAILELIALKSFWQSGDGQYPELSIAALGRAFGADRATIERKVRADFAAAKKAKAKPARKTSNGKAKKTKPRKALGRGVQTSAKKRPGAEATA